MPLYLLLLAELILVVEQLETVKNVLHRDQRIGKELISIQCVSFS